MTSLFLEYGITVELGKELYRNEDDTTIEYYYSCKPLFRELAMQLPENNNPDDSNQFYAPIWVSVNELEEMIVYPESVKVLVQEINEH